MTTFLAGTVKAFTYAPQVTELGWLTLFVDAFLEDTYRITPRLQVRLGFRSESSTRWSEPQGRAGVYAFTKGVINSTPSVQQNAIDQNRALFLPEPRAGLAWDVFGNRRTSVTAGAGLHHSLLDVLDYRLDQAAPYNIVQCSRCEGKDSSRFMSLQVCWFDDAAFRELGMVTESSLP